MFIPDHVKEAPESSGQSVGLRRPQQSHVSSGFADVIEGGQRIVQEHPHRDQIRDVFPLGQVLSVHGLGQVLQTQKLNRLGHFISLPG